MKREIETMTIFLRLLKTDIDAKAARLAEQVNALNAGQPAPDTFAVAPTEFRQIPGSPFAYWASESIFNLFRDLPFVEKSGITAQYGASTKNDFRFLRLWWEVLPSNIGKGLRWVHHAKGGQYSHYFSDIHLLINWSNDAQEIKDYITERYPYLKGETAWLLHPESSYFHAGVTWTRRTGSELSVRALPVDTVFGDKGPSAFVENNDLSHLLSLLGIMNSKIFSILVALQLGTATVGHSFEVGIIQRTPLPLAFFDRPVSIAELASQAHNIVRDINCEENTHAFCLPAIVLHQRESLQVGLQAARASNARAQSRLTTIQAEIDRVVAELYGLTEADLADIAAGSTSTAQDTEGESPPDEENEDEDTGQEIANPKSEIENLLMWCLGCAFGRWDIRFALDQTLLPKLQEPFDPLPRCSPGMLVGTDGLPAQKGGIVSEEWLRARPNVITLPDANALIAQGLPLTTDRYPLNIDWDGIMPDDEDHPDDIVRRVREVLELLWQDRAEAIEQEACQILGVESLREYFRHPKYFFDFHIKRYSKSRRKAPIYWLLQSVKKNYGLWIYYHRIDADTLFKALTLYADPKLNLENIRLNDLRAQLTPDLPARDRRTLEKALAKQEALISELTDFRNELERVARLQLTPDFNDGVIISIAPLHNLVPWKEAAKMWTELTQGKYEWSTMSQRMRQRGLVRVS